jgi:hypothetical protein
VRRFPAVLAGWRRHGIDFATLHQMIPQIIAEYHRIIAKERPWP